MRFKTEKLGDFLYVKGRIGWKGLKKDEYLSDGVYRIINGEALTKDGIDWSKAGFISKERYEESPEIMLQNDDILISKDGTIGKLGFIRNLENPSTVASGIFVLRNLKPEMINIRFIYNYLSSVYFRNFIISRTEGSVIPHLYQKDFVDLYFPLPSLKEQNKIVDVLDTISCKIEINKMINNNLEQQAQAIFINEFISLKMPPDGWKQASLIDIADYLNGLAMQKYRPTDDEIGIQVLKIKELRQGCCDNNSELCSPNIKSEYIIHDGDVIFSWSGSLLVDFWCGGICGLNQHLFKVTSSKYDKWFYYAWTKHHLDRFISVAADKATTMGHIKRDELAKAEVFIPNESDYIRIGALLQPIYDLIISNRIENKKLVLIRDTLLPKLMSGELDVSNIDF